MLSNWLSILFDLLEKYGEQEGIELTCDDKKEFIESITDDLSESVEDTVWDLRVCVDDPDIESAHMRADSILCSFIESIGEEIGIDLSIVTDTYYEVPKWFA